MEHLDCGSFQRLYFPVQIGLLNLHLGVPTIRIFGLSLICWTVNNKHGKFLRSAIGSKNSCHKP